MKNPRRASQGPPRAQARNRKKQRRERPRLRRCRVRRQSLCAVSVVRQVDQRQRPCKGGGAPRSLTTSDSAGHRVERRRLIPVADQASQRPYCSLGGCNSPFIQACTSDNRMGSTSSHRTHWKVRRPDFKTTKCIALRHSGQGGVYRPPNGLGYRGGSKVGLSARMPANTEHLSP
jgi:hypothetical protein